MLGLPPPAASAKNAKVLTLATNFSGLSMGFGDGDGVWCGGDVGNQKSEHQFLQLQLGYGKFQTKTGEKE